MDYERKYPGKYEDDEICEGVTIMGRKGRCGSCGKETRVYDQSLGVYVCSEECEEKLWQSEPK